MGLFNKRTTDIHTGNLVNDFVNKSAGLIRILEKETEYFRERKVRQAEQLAETKIILIDELESIKTSLTANPLTIINLPVSEKQRLKEANNILLKVSEANYNETLVAQEVNKLVLEAISDAVNQSRAVEGAYGEKGKIYKNSESAPISVSTNA